LEAEEILNTHLRLLRKALLMPVYGRDLPSWQHEALLDASRWQNATTADDGPLKPLTENAETGNHDSSPTSMINCSPRSFANFVPVHAGSPT
jgi:hypothetical protein